MKKKIVLTVLIVLAVVILLVVAGLISLATLDHDWLKEKLRQKAKASLDADLDIETVSFEPFKGSASASGVTLKRRAPKSQLDVTLPDANMQLSLGALLLRKVHIKHLELNGPDVRLTVERDPQTPTKSTMDKLVSVFKKKDEAKPTKPPRKPAEWRVDRLVIGDGSFDYQANRAGSPPFRATITDLEYSAQRVSMHTLHRLLYGADITANFETGGKTALDKSGSARPATMDLTGVNLGYVDRYFDQTDALIVTAGQMNVHYTIRDGMRTQAEVKIDGFELGKNEDAENQQFMFIPVDRIIQYVSDRGGEIDLSFELSDELTASEDLEQLAREFWKGMWIAILRKVSPGSAEDLMEQGKQRALEFLKKREAE